MRPITALSTTLASIWCVCSPLMAWGQLSIGQSEQTSTAKHRADLASIATGHPNASQDRQFLGIVRLRDTLVSSGAELQSIVNYHENLRSRLSDGFNEYPNAVLSREKFNAAINDVLAGVKSFEDQFKAAQTDDEKKHLLSAFDRRLQFSALEAREISSTIRLGHPSDRARRLSISRERTTLAEVFQGVSTNKHFLSKYDTLLKVTENYLIAWEKDMRTPLDDLPRSFNDLARVRAPNSMTGDQVQFGIDKYRETLQEATKRYQPPSPQATKDALTKVLELVDTAGQELAKKQAAVKSEFDDFERTISSNAKSIYGNKVGADSFNYLLLVFAAVFIVIMLIPRLYTDSAIAANLLKAEFLLQFSTVFVLIAAIIILGIGDLIDKDQLPVLLAGISGYVLGQLGKAGSQPATAQPQQ